MYFDYCASTPMSKKSREAYIDIASKIYANVNAKHTLGTEAMAFYNKVKQDILSLMNASNSHLTFVANASEANRLILNKVLHTPQSMHVICGPFEHPSIVTCLSKLQQQGLTVDVVETDETGLIDASNVLELIQDSTALIIISNVDSELGIIQDLKYIKSLVGDIPIMSDITQAITKIPLNMSLIDYASFSSHKFFGPKGCGAIISKKASFTEEGTPSLELAYATQVSLEESLKINPKIVHSLNQYCRLKLNEINSISINNPQHAIPHILNISLMNTNIDDLVSYFSRQGIYVSKAHACSNASYSHNIYRLSQSMEKAQNSIRISLSHLTTQDEIDGLIQAIRKIYYENH